MNTATKSIALLAVLATVTGVGLALTGFTSRTGGPDPDIAHDLTLAAASTDISPSLGVTNALETAPMSAPEAAPVVREAPGPKVTRARRAPTVRSTPAATPAVAEVEASPMILTPISAQSASAEGSSDGVALPRPVPATYPGTGSSGDGDWGEGGSGRGGSGGGMGGVIGVIIRGGGVHGDNCELHDRGRRRPVYSPSPTGVATGSRGGIRSGTVVTGSGGAMRPSRPPSSVSDPTSRPSRGAGSVRTGRSISG